MDIRDQFALVAMQSIILVLDGIKNMGESDEEFHARIARHAYYQADAMMKERLYVTANGPRRYEATGSIGGSGTPIRPGGGSAPATEGWDIHGFDEGVSGSPTG